MSFIVSIFHRLAKFLCKYIPFKMNESKEQENDSDLISTDSWTFLDDSDKDPPKTCTHQGKVNDNLDTNNEFHSVVPEKHSKRNKQTKTKHRLKRKSRMSRKEALNILSIFGAMLTVSGLYVILMIFPEFAVDDRSFSTIEENFMYMTANKNISYEDALRNLSKTLEVVNTVKSANLEQKLMENVTHLDICQLSEKPLFMNENIITENNANETVFKEKELNETRHSNNSAVNSFLKFCRTPKFHILLSTIIHDLFLFKVFLDYNRNRNNTTKPKNISNKVNEEKRMDFKSVSSREKYETINNNTGECSSQNMLYATKLKSTPIIKFQKPASELLLNKSVMNIPVDSNGSQQQNLYFYTENNKSEKVDYYKEQFKKLENMWNNIGQNHRQNIQLIKEQFHNEIAQMNEKPLESSSFISRKEKILLLREKYTDQLKRNRELYLTELKKIREEREKIIKNLCINSHRIKNDQKMSNKYDSTVDSSDLCRKLLLLKQQQANLTNNNEIGCNTTEEFKNNSKSLTTKLNEKRIQHNKHKQKYLKRKIKCFRGNYRNVSSLHNNNTNCRNQSGGEMDLYEALFERNAKTIKNNDMIKWYPRKRSQQFEIIYKRDPKNITKNSQKTFSYKDVL